MIERLRQAARYLNFLRREYSTDRCAQAAASLAFMTLLSLVPLAALLAWLTRPFHPALAQSWRALGRFFTPTAELDRVIGLNVERYAENATALGVLGLLFFMFVAWGMLGAIESVVNDIWHVQRRRGHARRFVGFWGMVMLAPLLFLAGATLKTSLEREVILAGLMDRPFFAWILVAVVPFLLMVASAAVAYWILPNTHVKARAALAGGLVTGIVYQLVRSGFALYVTNVATYDRIYGILGVVPAFLVWLFAAWSVFLVGAEVAYTAQYPWDAPVKREEPRAIAAKR